MHVQKKQIFRNKTALPENPHYSNFFQFWQIWPSWGSVAETISQDTKEFA